MRIGIYNPYLNTLGGGERYCFDIASCFVGRGDTVDLFWDDSTILARARARFGINTEKIHIVSNVWQHGSWALKLKTSRAYDVLFWMSDGSIPTSLSGKTYMIFQFPVSGAGTTAFTRIKLQRYAGVICYSRFVKEHIDRVFGVNAQVLAPAIDTTAFISGKKEKLILSVGRFTQNKNAKKQEFLISAFKKLSKTTKQPWKLVLAGGMLKSEKSFVDTLRTQSQGYSIAIVPNISLPELKALYAQASIYWHAAGVNEDISAHPDRAEHFGITTLEAMSAGAVPVVFEGGGQKEIVSHGADGFLWKTEKELLRLTQKLLDDASARKKLANAATVHAQSYSKETFCARVLDLA